MADELETQYKAFHFQEIDWRIYFPIEGNSGKYPDYNIVLITGGNRESPGERLKLGDVLSRPEVEQNYPHCIGYFKVPWGDAVSVAREYLELREVRSVEEFWAFLNAVNL